MAAVTPTTPTTPTTSDMCEIVPGLWLASMFSAQPDTLHKYGITHVVSVMPVSNHIHNTLASNGFILHIIEELDGDDTNLIQHFPHAVAFITHALGAGLRVLVHCVAGVSRSPTLVAAYLIQEMGMTTDEALARIRRVRPFIEPKRGFVAQLRDWEEQCRTPTCCEKLMWQKLDI